MDERPNLWTGTGFKKPWGSLLSDNAFIVLLDLSKNFVLNKMFRELTRYIEAAARISVAIKGCFFLSLENTSNMNS